MRKLPPEPPEQLDQHQARQGMEDEVGALEGQWVSWPVVSVQQKAQQDERASQGIGCSGGDVSPETGTVGDWPGRAESGQIREIVKNKGATQPCPTGRKHQ